MVTDGVLEGSETFDLEVNMTSVSPPGSIGGTLPVRTITITGMDVLAVYIQKR